MLEKLGNLLQGKKRWIVTILTFVAGGLQAIGITIPPFVWTLLAAAGLGAIGSAIKKIEKK